jgi:CHAT domain-containing protein
LGQLDSAFVKLDYVKSRALRRRMMAGPGSGTQTSHLLYADREQILKQLRSNEMIIDYMIAEDTLYTFALSSSGLQVFPEAVNKHELEILLMEYLAQLTPPEEKPKRYDAQRQQQEFLKVIQLSHTLYDRLMRRMGGMLEKVNRLYIVPDEFLHLLPFNTLALQEGLAPEFLVEQKAIMYLPAASFIANSREGEVTRSGLLASIDPAMHGANMISERLARLQNMAVITKTRWEDSTEIASTLAEPFQAYFFFAHAQTNWDDPWQSYMSFPLQSKQEYGKLIYPEVDAIDWRGSDLVILAGCETAGNRTYRGAGLSGLQRSFLGAGAQQVLATFWKVDAGQVAPQMGDFVDAWDSSGEAILALQKMQQAAIQRLTADSYLIYPHPRYWGAYNLIGTKLPALASSVYAGRVVP